MGTKKKAPSWGRSDLPVDALFHISEISAIVGEGIASTAERLVVWGGKSRAGYLIYLRWGAEADDISVTLCPGLDDDYKIVYGVMGYCLYHNIPCEVSESLE